MAGLARLNHLLPGIHNQEPTISLLQEIPVVRTHVALLRLLKLRQTQIPWAPIPVPILHPTCREIDTAAQRTQANKSDTYAIPGFETWRVSRLERVRGNDPADVAEADLPGGPDGSAVVSAQVQVEPTDNDWHGGVDAHRNEEEGSILEVEAVMDGKENAEAGDGHQDGDESKNEAVPRLIRKIGDEHCESECRRPRWY